MAILLVTTLILMMASLLWLPEIRLFKKSVQSFWVIALVGASLLLLIQPHPLQMIQEAWLTGTVMNPLRILGLFFAFTVLAIFLDEVGLIKYLAYVAVNRAGSSQKRLFLIWFVVIAIATTLTANDIVVLTLTPFMIYFARHAKISPLPYLIAQFVSANTWSMLLVIGNPTNIYLATMFAIDFLTYFQVMVLPTLITGLASYFILYALFARQLRQPISKPDMAIHLPHPSYRIGVTMLALAIGLMIAAQWLGIGMDALTIMVAILLMIVVVLRYPKTPHLFSTVKRLPYEMIPFFLSMAILVHILGKIGWTEWLQTFLGSNHGIYTYGISSFIVSNLINNIPMSLWFTEVISGTSPLDLHVVYAAIIGSNLGALLTPVGSLAGLMWMGILKTKQVKLSFTQFVGYGLILGPLLLAIALVVLDMIS